MAKPVALLLEDDNAISTIAKTILESQGMIALVAHNTTVARDFMENAEGDVILSDMFLPKESGIDFVREVRSNPQTESIPVVMMTAAAEENLVVEAKELRVQEFIV